jgi:hypothetical protein
MHVVIFAAWLYTARMMVTAQQPLKVIVSVPLSVAAEIT